MSSSNLSQHSSKVETESGGKVGSVTVGGEAEQFVILGNKKYYKHELMQAFGGTLYPQPAPLSDNKFGNPAVVGLSAFAMTTFVLSLTNAGAQGIHIPNIVIGLSCFYGGVVQFCAGIWELFLGNTFGATALTSYGAFWLSYSAIFIEAFGIAAAYEDEMELANAVGFFLVGWAIFTFLLTLVTLKSTVAFFSLFFFLTITFILLACGEFTGHASVTKAGGVIGVITAFIAWYNAWAGVATKQLSYITSKSFPLTKRD